MQYLYLLPLAAFAVANPLERRGDKCADNECLAAVTGPAALGDGKLRASHCASYLATTVTPPAVTVTATVTGEEWKDWQKRASVTVCPNDVPNYASACDDAGYSSACSCFGFTEVKTTTIAPTTTTKTVYVKATSCDGKDGATVTVTEAKATVTVTEAKVTVTEAKETVTATVTEDGKECPTGSPDVPDFPEGKCLSDEDAEKLTENFADLLRYTSYNGTQGRPGRGYKQDVSDATLATDFVDISDSINFMAGFPLGSVTFANKAAFDYGQGVLQPEVLADTLNVWHGCKDITWRWKITPQTASPYPVNGINYMIINDEGKIQKNYAEFDNGAWLQSFPGSTCALRPVTVAPETALKN